MDSDISSTVNQAIESIKNSTDIGNIDKCLLAMLEKIESEDLEALDEDVEENKKSYTIGLIKANVIELLVEQLKVDTDLESQHQRLITQLLAEFAKTESGRERCTAEGPIVSLLNLLSRDRCLDATQACRALGNICYDNGTARDIINNNQGVEKLLQLMRDILNDREESSEMLRKVACGFFFNLNHEHEKLMERSIAAGVIDVLDAYLEAFADDGDSLRSIVLALDLLTETNSGKIHLANSNIIAKFSNLLKGSADQELKEMILAVLSSIAENSEGKDSLVKNNNGLVDVLLDSMELNNGDDKDQLTALFSDFIVLLLTGDESMKLLYDDGKGRILSCAIEWMKSSSQQLQTAGTLAISNIARTDDHCTQLVKNGITEELLNLLRRHPVTDGNIVLHHAIFGALRNLAIPAENKSLMLECHLLESILPYLESDSNTVLFKLLGTVRMITVNQAAVALSLCMNDSFLSKLIGWCSCQQHEGVKGEANRLVAWLIKYCQSTTAMLSVVQHGAVPKLVEMLGSEHVLMQIEAIVALCVLAVSILDNISGIFVETNLISQLKSILSNAKNSSESALIHNIVKLLSTLQASKVIADQIKSSLILEEVEKYENHEDAMLREVCQNVVKKLGLTEKTESTTTM